jgi:hypothetical protein
MNEDCVLAEFDSTPELPDELRTIVDRVINGAVNKPFIGIALRVGEDEADSGDTDSNA